MLVSILGGEELVKEMILISQSHDEVQIMDPETYKTFDVKKPLNIPFDSNRVGVVIIEDTLFVLPWKKLEI